MSDMGLRSNESTHYLLNYGDIMNRIRTLKYSLGGCVLALFFSSYVIATTTKTVNFVIQFASLESFLSTYYKYFSKVINLNE